MTKIIALYYTVIAALIVFTMTVLNRGLSQQDIEWKDISTPFCWMVLLSFIALWLNTHISKKID